MIDAGSILGGIAALVLLLTGAAVGIDDALRRRERRRYLRAMRGAA